MSDYMHPGYRKPYPIETVLRDLASQEGCDGEPYDAMIFAAARIADLERQLAEAREVKAERDRFEIALEDIADGMGETELTEIGRFAPVVARAALQPKKSSTEQKVEDQ